MYYWTKTRRDDMKMAAELKRMRHHRHLSRTRKVPDFAKHVGNGERLEIKEWEALPEGQRKAYRVILKDEEYIFTPHIPARDLHWLAMGRDRR